MAYPKADAFIPATIYKWEQNCCLIRDDDGNQYIHFYNADVRWYDPESGWNQYMHKGELRVMLRVGKNSGPRGRIGFIHHLLVERTTPAAEAPDVCRSPADVFRAPTAETTAPPVATGLMERPSEQQPTIDALLDDIREQSKRDKVRCNVSVEGEEFRMLHAYCKREKMKYNNAVHRAIRAYFAFLAEAEGL